MDQATRLRRREEARRRVRRQRQLALAALVGLIALGAGVVVLLGGGGSGGVSSAAEGATAKAAPKPAELPRGGRTIFPDYRVVAFYGAPQDDELGALGIGTPDQATAKLEKQARPYGGRGRKLLPALELIAVVAAGAPHTDQKYRWRESGGIIRRYLRAARRDKALLLLDIQPGRADFMSEVRRLEPFLRQPDVSLALDPEWHVGPTEVPGQVIGSVDASEVNQVTDYLAGIVRAGDLPEKLLVIHQFTDNMVRNKQLLHQPPGIALTLNVDGFGTAPEKVSKYRLFAHQRPRAHRGFKLFYKEDSGLMSPGSVMRLRPRPELIVYE
ncbi:MAG: hypothetical protein QOG63_2427 [Thermoleophilaceae bacterium]|nr:hypothetical protein [Thermoleophilaceae bacterium]